MSNNTKTDVSPAVEVAKQSRDGHEPAEMTLPNGSKVRLVPISASLIDAVTSRIRDPEIPMWMNKDKGREEPNPSDPNYIREMEDAGRKRGIAAMDAMVMFGVELVDGLPDDDKWLKKLQNMEKHGLLDLSGYDFDDETDKEFVYKRFVAVDTNVIERLSEISGISAEDVEEAERSFRGNEER
jgi:hypothetical protein